jgi:hypothetical protein
MSSARTVITTVPSVTHAEVVVARNCRTEVLAMMLIVASPAVHPPAVPTTVGHIEVRTSEVEVVTVRVAGIDAEMPVACFPEERTIEIGGGQIGFPLPSMQDELQVGIAALPVEAKHVVTTSDTHQIIKVDFVGSLILGIGQIQLVCHLVGQEQGLSPCLLVAHGLY